MDNNVNESQGIKRKPRATLLKRNIIGSPAQTRSASKIAGKRGNSDIFASASQDSYLANHSLSPKKSKRTMNDTSMHSTEGGSDDRESTGVTKAMEDWAQALDELDNQPEIPSQLAPYQPPPPNAASQATQQPPLTLENVEGLLRHYMNEQTTRLNAKTEKLTNVVKAQGGVLSSLSGQVKKLDNSSVDMQERMKKMEEREVEREKRFNDKLSQVTSQVSLSKLGGEIAKSKLEILFFKVPFNSTNKDHSKELVRGWVENCKEQADLVNDIKASQYQTLAPKGTKKTDPHRMVKVTCVSEDIRKELLKQLKKEGVLPEGVSVTEVYPEKFRNKARDLSRIGNFVRGISNNVVKFKVIIDNFELQLRLKFNEDGDFIIQKSWTPPTGSDPPKVCIDYGVPNTPPHTKNVGKKGTPLSPLVLKAYSRSIQINSKTNIENADFPTYKTAIENEWLNKDQKVQDVLPGGKKSLYVTFDSLKHACEAFDLIKASKAKYWPQMTTIYMVNFNV